MDKLQLKKECENTPQGYSYSESQLAYYFHIRKGDTIWRIRIKKDDKRWETHKVDNGPYNF
jgi:hypothetical protein